MTVFTLNGKRIETSLDMTMRLRDALYRLGCTSVRDSDDAEGFTGSDVVIMDGKLRSSNLTLLYQAQGHEIRTAESLRHGQQLNDVQEAMIAAGVVQSAYNSPTAALILTWLLERKADATRRGPLLGLHPRRRLRALPSGRPACPGEEALWRIQDEDGTQLPRWPEVHRKADRQGRWTCPRIWREGLRRGQGGRGCLCARRPPLALRHGLHHIDRHEQGRGP